MKSITPKASRASRQPQRRRGLVLVDAVVAIALLAILLLAMTGVMTYQHKALIKLADRRAATRLAERTLLALQSGTAGPAPSEGIIARTPLAAPAAPAGYLWLDVRATVGSAKVHLAGLVPARAGGPP